MKPDDGEVDVTPAGEPDGAGDDQAVHFAHVAAILNPASGRGTGERWVSRLSEALALAFREHAGCRTEVRLTTSGESAESLAREAAEAGCDLVIAAGGDGTLGGVINGVAGFACAVGLVPLGTGNDFARAVGVPLDPLGALGRIAAGSVRRIDVGIRDARRFVNVAGCGFDARVAERINAGYRSLRGSAAYVAAVAQTLLDFRASRFRVTVDNETIEEDAMMCAVANGTGYGGGMRVAPMARWDDGLLDVCLVLACKPMEFVRAFPTVYRGKHVGHPKVRYRRGARVLVECDPPQPVLLDGEVVTPTPARFDIIPGAIRFAGGETAARHVQDRTWSAKGGAEGW
jgi:diacylglycerol kinase (ATP)